MKNEKSGLGGDTEHRHEIAETRERVTQALFDLYNQLTVAPIDLPHRNTLRGIVSAAYHLAGELGSDQSRVEEARQKVAATLERFGQ